MDLIIGADGQLGTELRKLLDIKGTDYVSTNSSEMDITDESKVQTLFNEIKPNFVYHCAAYTQVDKAESESKELNEKVNVEGTRNVSEASKSVNATLVYISTDYVFDGSKEDEYKVDDKVNPKNEYGRAKYAGEELVKAICSKYYIIRTSWVFGEFGANFVYTMLRLAKTNKILSVVDDQIGRPTWTRTLAEFMVYLKENQVEYGMYHLSNDNYCSWYEFAKEILKNHDVAVNPISSKNYPQIAYRPKNSILDLSKTKDTGFYIPNWQEALEKFTSTL